jgi:hypothetical protein
MRSIIKGLALAAALILGPCLAHAADDYTVKDSAGSTITIRAPEFASKKYTAHTVANSTGTIIDPSTAGNQATGNTSLGSIDTKLTSTNSSLSSVDTKLTSTNTKLDTLHTDLGAATPAGEAHTGEVGTNGFVVTTTPTVSTSPAYTSGDAVGALQTLANAVRVSGSAGASGTSAYLQSVIVNSKSAQSSLIDIFLFKANPSGSTCTDNAAFVLATADFDKVVGVVHVADWTAGNTASVGQAHGMGIMVGLSSATTLYACAVTRATPTLGTTSDLTFNFTFARN